MNNYDYEHITVGSIPDPSIERDCFSNLKLLVES